MVASENLRRELEEIDRKIEELREVEYRVETDFGAVREGAGWLRAVYVFLLRRDLARQLRNLKLRREMASACYAEAKRYEEWLARSERAEPRERKTVA